jgi:MFS family permease
MTGRTMNDRWLMLALLFLVRTSMGFQFQSVASTAPFLTSGLDIGYTQIGTLIGVYMLPGIVMALPGGMLGRRFADKAICAAGLGLMIIGGVTFALGDSYGTAVLGRIIGGFGSVLLSLVITKMVTDWFAGREIVTAMGVMLASWPFGIALGLVAQAPLAVHAGWPAVMWATVMLCGAAVIAVVALYRPPLASVAPVDDGDGRRGLRWRETLPVVAAGVMWGVFNVGLVIFFSFTPALLTDHGLGLVEAGTLVSLGLWVSIPALPLGGWVAERAGYPNAAIIVFSVGAGVILLGLIYGPLPALLCALLGIVIGPPAGAIMALPAQVLSPRRRALGLGVFYTVYYVIMTIGPLVAGWCRDHWHAASAAVLFGVALYWSIPLIFLAFYAFARASPPLSTTVDS